MQHPQRGRRSAPFIAPSEACLPGFAPSDIGVQPPETPAGTPRLGWWVKQSATQLTDSAGQPAGFKHTLMYGDRVVMSGTGADCARTFQRQAEFFNLNKGVPCNRSAPPGRPRD
jgi:hypothetical protein